MNTKYQSTEVYSYLSYLEYYLVGDLNSFHKICEQAEKDENNIVPIITASNSGIIKPLSQQVSVSTVTTKTTLFPGSIPTLISSLSSSSQFPFRLTIPITLTLFATVDLIGYLSGTNEKYQDTKKNFIEFFKQSLIPVTEKESIFINEVFRQGLTHVYFPKLGLGISYHSNNPSDELIFKDNIGNLILNVNRLEEIVISTFRTIKNNSSLYFQMEKRYLSLKNDYQAMHEVSIKNYSV
jgi:hypothetical protein